MQIQWCLLVHLNQLLDKFCGQSVDHALHVLYMIVRAHDEDAHVHALGHGNVNWNRMNVVLHQPDRCSVGHVTGNPAGELRFREAHEA